MTSICVLTSRLTVADQPQPTGDVISMTANKSAPRPRALQPVRRAARALKRINDEQVSMWEAFWRANRFPAD
jgi:hypothetical protein